MGPELRNAVLLAGLIALSFASEARRSGCDDAKLPPDQRWNGATSYSTPALARFYDLSNEMSAAYKAHSPSTDALAREYLSAAAQYPCNWNYGNAIHNANTILGLLALQRNQKAEAVAYLRAAGASPGSPQLDTFGPSLRLASELAKAGEYTAVVDYLNSIKTFWKAEDQSVIGTLFPVFSDPDRISTWVKQLNNRRVPDFDAPFHMDPP